MTATKKANPAGGPGFARQHTKEHGLLEDSTALQQAAATALARELWIIQQAARRCCGYWSLAHEDVERVDQACGHVLAVLSVLTERELLT